MEKSCPIDVDNLMTMFEDGQGREVIHELAAQLHALQREFYELKAGGLTIHELRDDLEKAARKGRAPVRPPGCGSPRRRMADG